MKKLSSIIIICIIGFSAMSQDTTKVKQHNNEFGIDITGFLKQYLNFGSQQTIPYNPTYYLTYRRHFSCGNLRVGIGGDFSSNEVPANNSNDTTIYYSTGYSVYASLGWEFCSNLSKKWQAYYGADCRTSIIYSKSDATNYYGPDYTVGEINNTKILSISPLIGIRFKLTKRLSILTEASYSINWEKLLTGNFYIGMPGNTVPLPPTVSHLYNNRYTSFSQPLDVFVDFAL